ncbi:hypothetical protein CYMTET_5338 [Cymbomonas tetramitiformis]|uniref:Prolyl 4-hydroxylase alpha subunit Fe(2+) 2OG dioxygenase domain-containing protein n=1 Tax=Cymbomonas tetramitiformis TaxID=36881 RepID=A0AAE0GZD4_9CHLO|nr:hypothetical protein CYMTET_5338 [Cymbomonas tetramitiformis]
MRATRVAVLYLNSKGHSFQGGDFAFNDLDEDQLVEPVQGRCVLFPSGAYHLHQAREVESGSRFVLAMWFTLTQERGEVIQSTLKAYLTETACVSSAATEGTR